MPAQPRTITSDSSRASASRQARVIRSCASGDVSSSSTGISHAWTPRQALSTPYVDARSQARPRVRPSVVTTLTRTRGRAWDLASTYGVERACRGVHACEIPVLELETSPDAQERITQACREALALDESDVIVLGCAGMADLCAHISEAIGAPVVDGVAAAVVTVEGLVRLGLRTSGINEYATPPAKAYTGLLSGFALGQPADAADSNGQRGELSPR